MHNVPPLSPDDRRAAITVWKRILAEVDASPPRVARKLRPLVLARLRALRRLDYPELVRLGICGPDHVVGCGS